MCMKVNVDEATWDITIRYLIYPLIQLKNCLLCCIDSRMHCRIWVLVKPIQVLIQGVLPVVTSKNSIRIQTRYDLEDIAVSQ
jgi:hypothetical protein